MMITGLNVLVVEDELTRAWAIAEALNRVGASVIGPVASVSDALEQLTRQDIHAAVLDANLLDRDITPVAKILVARKTPLVLYAAAGIPEHLDEFEGILSVVPKSASISHLLEVLAQTIDSMEPSRD